MSVYKKNLWTINVIILMAAILLTFSIKIIITPLLLTQQRSLIQKFNLRNIAIISNAEQLTDIINSKEFAYIKISNSTLTAPLSFKNRENTLLPYLFSISSITVYSQNGQQSIEFKAQFSQLTPAIEHIVITLYCVLILLAFIINISNFRLLNRVEVMLINNILDAAPKNPPFPKVSEQLHKQKKLFQEALQKQAIQILQLTRKSNKDNLTGLGNQNAFRNKLIEIVSEDNEHKHALLFIIRASELSVINSLRGFQYGNDYIQNIAHILHKVTRHLPTIETYRISGSDFALIAREMKIKEAQSLAKELKMQFDQYQVLNKISSVAYTGISAIKSGQLPDQVLARADMALAKAQSNGANSWAFEQKGGDECRFGQPQWRKIIEKIICKRALMLLHQPIEAIHRNMHGYQEIFTCFVGDNNKIIPTKTVFAMAQRVDMIIKLEQLILETVVSQYRYKAEHNTLWGINITSSAIQNSPFTDWLERLLLREPDIAINLVFEMREDILESNIVASKRIFDMLKRTGARSAICQFGKGIGSFRLFAELKPDFVKIDTSLIHNIVRNNADQKFVNMIIDAAHRMDCLAIAKGVENLDQKQILESMYIDGLQGFLIARPSPL